jgi:hypothetical protein
MAVNGHDYGQTTAEKGGGGKKIGQYVNTALGQFLPPGGTDNFFAFKHRPLFL